MAWIRLCAPGLLQNLMCPPDNDFVGSLHLSLFVIQNLKKWMYLYLSCYLENLKKWMYLHLSCYLENFFECQIIIDGMI